MSQTNEETYGLSARSTVESIPAPELAYRPARPDRLDHGIGLVGCGGITQHHLTAYRNAGFRVVAFCDRERSRAEKMRDAFFPEAVICENHSELLAREDVNVVDIATHPHQRVEIIEAALESHKHVLSQKPFVLDLDVGERLIALAESRATLLAVNQNGRWAPHFSWMRAAVRAGCVGEVTSVNFQLNWDHGWIAGTEFEKMHHILLYDFALHWFDMAAQLLDGHEVRRVTSCVTRVAGQKIAPPLLAGALIEYEDAVASLAFNGASLFGAGDRTLVTGTLGTLESRGPDLNCQALTLSRAEGVSYPKLEGAWFPDGFQGAMAELLCAIEQGRQPANSAQDNLRTLKLVFAAIRSANTNASVVPGTARKLDVETIIP